MKTLNVYDFTDYRAYLGALIEQKRVSGEFSYAKFAERAGFQSRSYLRTVITGKRNLSADAVAKIINGFALNHQEAEGFKALTQFNQAKNFTERYYYWECFLKSRPKNSGSQKIADEYKYLARSFYPALLVILRQTHIKKSVSELARLVNATEKEVQEGLDTLVSLGAASKTDDGYVASATPYTTSNDVPSIAIQTFHSNMLDKAKKALSLSPLEREFQTQMVALSEEEMKYIKTRVRALMEEVGQKFGGKRNDSKKIYALNMNLIPITPDFIRADSASEKLASSNGDDNEENS